MALNNKMKPSNGKTVGQGIPKKNKNKNRKIKTNKNNRPKNKRLQVARTVPLASTTQGVEFLKVAFAGPDFDQCACQGVPDEYTGRTLVVNDKSNEAVLVPAITPAVGAMYIIMVPIPGVAYITAVVASSGTVTYTPTFYKSTKALLGDGTTISNMTLFRYVAQQMEIVWTTNEFKWFGVLEAFKTTVEMQRSVTGDISLNGFVFLETDLTTLENARFVTKAEDGLYAIATNTKDIFEWVTQVPYATGAILTDTGASINFPPGTSFTGIGSMEALVFKLPIGATGQEFYLRTWTTVEYQIQPTSPFYQFATNSPPHDPVAMEHYRKVKSQLPIAVVQAENASFWTKVVNFVKKGATMVGWIPGPVGMIGNGVAGVISALQEMFV